MNADERRGKVDALTERIIGCAPDVGNAHMAQCLNYLKGTGLTVCLLINFGRPRVEVKRIVNGFRIRVHRRVSAANTDERNRGLEPRRTHRADSTERRTSA